MSRLNALVLDKAHQSDEAFALLSRARLLFIARHPDRFTSKVFAEIGVIVGFLDWKGS